MGREKNERRKNVEKKAIDGAKETATVTQTDKKTERDRYKS